MSRMIHRLLLILFATLGIVATFLPWLHYPKVGGVFYGYMADGILTGIVFLVILLYNVFTLKRQQAKAVPFLLMAGFGLLMAIASFAKHIQIEAEKQSFSVDDPRIAAISAGFKQGIGIYVFGIAGFGVFAMAITSFILFRRTINDQEPKSNSIKPATRSKILISIAVLIILVSSLFYFSSQFRQPLSQDQLFTLINRDLNDMGEALAKGDYQKFVDYNHPMLVQSYGGKERTLELLEETFSQLNENGTYYKDISLKEIVQHAKRGENIQAIIIQSVIMNINNKDTVENQKMLAISEDNGRSFYYLNINDKTKEDIIKFYPKLNIKFNF